MIRKTFHILVITILALNLMGAWVFASILDCSMGCCEPSETAQAGIPTYEAPSCCDIEGVTCGFETGAVDELFDEALCCFNSAYSKQMTAVTIPAADSMNGITELRTHGRTVDRFQKPPLTQFLPLNRTGRTDDMVNSPPP